MAVIDLYHTPGTRDLRVFACLGVPLLCGILGALAYWTLASPTAGISCWLVGALLSLAGLLHPPALKPVLIGMMILSFPLRWTLFYVALVALYYLVFTPIGLLLRLIRPSPLRAFRTSRESSNWQARQPASPFAQYFKQH